MAYQGQGYLPTIGGRMFATARFNDQNIADTFKKVLAQSGAPSLQAGQYFTGEGGTEYRTVTGIDPNQPGWGNRVPTGYELIGYQSPEMYTGKQLQLYGNTPKTPGFAILRKQGSGQPAPAPAPEDPASSSLQEPQITAEAKKYREESEAKLAEAQTLLDNFKIEQNKAAEAKKLQEQMAIRAQGALASNSAMSQRQPSLQLSPAYQTPKTAGTQPFKRRRLKVMIPGSQVTSGLNIGSANLLNV